jgi:hypothetical protein
VKFLAIALGSLLALAGVLLVATPSAVLEFGRSILSPSVLYIAAVVRIIFGAVLLWVAPVSRAPKTLRVLGAVLIIAGAVTPFVGVERSRVVFDWMQAQGPLFTRTWASVAAVLGILIVYAIIAPRKFAA